MRLGSLDQGQPGQIKTLLLLIAILSMDQQENISLGGIVQKM